MTTNIFLAILIIGSVLIFSTVTILMLVFLNNDDDVAFGIGTVATALFIIFFDILTPSDVQMIENDYYAMMEDRPKCIDAVNVSLGCKNDYIYWQKDSIEKQHKYDSVKVKLENLQNKIIRVEDKTKPTDSVSVKTCIDGCWTQHVLNADLKKCQDECFR